jgi:hypothetical protein
MAFDGRSRVPKLNTVQNVGIEIARIYRKTKRGEIEASMATDSFKCWLC